MANLLVVAQILDSRYKGLQVTSFYLNAENHFVGYINFLIVADSVIVAHDLLTAKVNLNHLFDTHLKLNGFYAYLV